MAALRNHKIRLFTYFHLCNASSDKAEEGLYLMLRELVAQSHCLNVIIKSGFARLMGILFLELRPMLRKGFGFLGHAT